LSKKYVSSKRNLERKKHDYKVLPQELETPIPRCTGACSSVELTQQAAARTTDIENVYCF
jgi:hypothetical protein